MKEMMKMNKYEKLKKLLEAAEEAFGPDISPEHQKLLNGFRERIESFRKEEMAAEKLCAKLQEISDKITEISREIHE